MTHPYNDHNACHYIQTGHKHKYAGQKQSKPSVSGLSVSFQKPPPPARPGVPVPSVGEFIPEDLTIATTEIDFSDIPPPPDPGLEDGEVSFFVEYDKPPKVIGGFAEIQKHLKYPMVARKVGIEGIVFVRVLVGVDGRTEKMECIKAEPAKMGFEASAKEAIKQVRWEPAEQHDKKVRVWLTIPIKFSLS